jgi:hypothetical protein
MNVVTILILIKEILTMLKDSDGDGRLDIFDSEPDNPEVK